MNEYIARAYRSEHFGPFLMGIAMGGQPVRVRKTYHIQIAIVCQLLSFLSFPVFAGFSVAQGLYMLVSFTHSLMTFRLLSLNLGFFGSGI